MADTPTGFPQAWWEVAEVTFAIRSIAWEASYDDALSEYRSRIAGRKKSEKRLTARQFDTAVKGVHAALAGHSDDLAAIVARARWALWHRITPVFARPKGWEWTDQELDLILECRARYVEPRFLQYSKQKITETEGPSTDGRRVNPWARYPIPQERFHWTQETRV